MCLKFPRVVEAWLYGDPGEIGDALVRRTARSGERAAAVEQAMARPPREPRDRYYTQARRCHVKQIMRAKGVS